MALTKSLMKKIESLAGKVVDGDVDYQYVNSILKFTCVRLALKKHHGNKTQAMKTLGFCAQNFYQLQRRYGFGTKS